MALGLGHLWVDACYVDVIVPVADFVAYRVPALVAHDRTKVCSYILASGWVFTRLCLLFDLWQPTV
jgi:hypothetical protein